MRKGTIFISAVLTTFALVMLYRIASAYNETQNAAQIVAAPTTIVAPTATEPPTPTSAVLSPVQAAQLAAQVVGNPSLLSAESSTFNGADAYLITFTNNDKVYVGLDGQILSVQVAPALVNAAPGINPNSNGGTHNLSRGSGGEHHESGDDHHEQEHD